MTVDKPTPGNLIATVSELVDAVNSSVGGNDFTGDVSITAVGAAQPGLFLDPDDSIYFGNGVDDPENGPALTRSDEHIIVIAGVGDSVGLEVGGTFKPNGDIIPGSSLRVGISATGAGEYIQAIAQDHILFGVNEASSLELLGNGNINISADQGVAFHPNANFDIIAGGNFNAHASGSFNFGALNPGGTVDIAADSGVSLTSPGGISATASGTGAVGLFSDGPSEVIVAPTAIDIVANSVGAAISISSAGSISLTGSGVVDLSSNTEVNVQQNPGGSLGFFNVSAVARPVVPLTAPSVQNVIDALVALGLVVQHD